MIVLVYWIGLALSNRQLLINMDDDDCFDIVDVPCSAAVQ